MACFVNAFPILNQHITYDFEPCDNDVITTVDQSHGTSAGLAQLGRQYANRTVQETKKIRESSRALHTLQSMRDNAKGAGSAAGGDNADGSIGQCPADLDLKIDEIKNQLRRSETAKIKAEARLDALRNGGGDYILFQLPLPIANCLNHVKYQKLITFDRLFKIVKVDEFLQDAEGLAALGLMRSSSQLSFRVSIQF